MQSTTTDTIRVTINGDPRDIAAGGTIIDLLAHLGLHPKTVVVEHNRVIVRGAQLEATEVRAGDELELVHFVGGG